MVEAIVVCLLMDRVRCSLLEQVLDDGTLPQALLAIGLNLLLHLLGFGVPDVLSKHLEFLVSSDDLILEFSDLLL